MTRKLLLADDSITIQKLIELIITDEGFEIKTTNNGEEALSNIPSFQPDIVLADTEMPKMNGYQLCEKIKQDPAMHHIPVILLIGAFEPVNDELVKQVRADDVIIKPFEPQQLISKINAASTISGGVKGAGGAEAVVEAEAAGLEEAPVEEGLLTAEETPETVRVKAWPMEEGATAGTEELLEEESGTVTEETIPPAIEKAEAAEVKIVIPEVELPSKDELKEIFENTVNERISSLLSTLDIKEAILTSMMPLIKDSVEKITQEIAPDLAEKILKDTLTGSIETLTREIERALWETIPDLAEGIISKEIERIRSEF